MRLTTHSYSPSVLGKILRCGVREPSFREAAEALADLAELTISGRQVTRIAQEIGQELEADRDRRVEQLQNESLEPTVTTRPALAVIEVDGGRLQIRGQGDGPGAHQASWREDKLSLLATAAVRTFDVDPEPDLPACFRDRGYVEKLVRGIAGQSPLGESDPAAGSPVLGASPDTPQDADPPQERAPELLVRTYVASTCDSAAFGPMVAAEAKRRNFPAAASVAFVGDGAAWIWTLQREHFPDAMAVVDFLHVMGHVFAAAKSAAAEPTTRWRLFQEWAESCWQGRVGAVIERLGLLQENLGALSEEEIAALVETDPRKILAGTQGYLRRNRDRMDYPSYRRQGLPITSSHIESTVKRFNRRVKGTEKFWGDAGAEAILQLRAAFLSEDDRLGHHLRTRPCSPFRTYKARKDRKAA